MKFMLLIFLSLTYVLNVNAYVKRDLLQKSFDINSLKQAIILNQEWVSYPDYDDRAGWDQLTGSLKEDIVTRGENALVHEWRVVTATDYLEYERSGNRTIMQQPFGANRSALSSLVLAEMAEGKGRFLDQIANGIWFFCEKTSWVMSAHMSHHTRNEWTALPDYNEFVIDLLAGDIGSFLSWTYHFLKDPLDKNVSPLISARLRQNLQERILDAYMNIDYNYLAFDATPFTKVNNWNPWVNFNVISAFLLLENDPDELAAAIYRSMISMDSFINYYHEDGATEEGTSYFTHAVGKMYDYLQILNYAGVPVSPVFQEPLIKRMGEFVSKAYIGDGWVVNYSDASPRYNGPVGVIYRYGHAVGSLEMKQFASYLYYRDNSDEYIVAGSDMFRTIENMITHQSVISTEPSVSSEPYTWYPQTELLYLRDKSGFFFSAKGGTNQQSHNHNDVGAFVLFYNSRPVFIDAGVGTYTRQTFSSERYSIWTMQSDYHNLPVINGHSQRSLGLDRHPQDEKYRARDVQFNAKELIFSADISGSYHPDSKAESWVRSYNLKHSGKLIIEDDFVLNKAVIPNQINFMTQAEPHISHRGKVILNIENKSVTLNYDPAVFHAVIKELPLDDPRLSRSWGDMLFRISFNAKELKNNGKYRFVIEKE